MTSPDPDSYLVNLERHTLLGCPWPSCIVLPEGEARMISRAAQLGTRREGMARVSCLEALQALTLAQTRGSVMTPELGEASLTG